MEKAVIVAALNGDEKAFEYIYTNTVDKAYGLAYGIIKDEYEAMDVLQDSYVKAWQNLDTLKQPEKFESWFFQIIRYKSYDLLDKHKHDILFSEMENSSEKENAIENTIVSEYQEFSPEESVDYQETQRILWGIVQDLPENQRTCILLRFRDNKKICEIAAETGMNESTVKSCLTYGKKKISEALVALEKQGTKLYGITPLLFLSFLRWMLGGSGPVAQTLGSANLAIKVAGTAAATTASAATSVGISETAASTGKAVAGAAKAAAGHAVRNAVLGICAAATVTAGATLVPIHDGNTVMDYIVKAVWTPEWKNYVSTAYTGEYHSGKIDVSIEIPQFKIETREAYQANQEILELCEDYINTLVDLDNGDLQSNLNMALANMFGVSYSSTVSYECEMDGNEIILVLKITSDGKTTHHRYQVIVEE